MRRAESNAKDRPQELFNHAPDFFAQFSRNAGPDFEHGPSLSVFCIFSYSWYLSNSDNLDITLTPKRTQLAGASFKLWQFRYYLHTISIDQQGRPSNFGLSYIIFTLKSIWISKGVLQILAFQTSPWHQKRWIYKGVFRLLVFWASSWHQKILNEEGTPSDLSLSYIIFTPKSIQWARASFKFWIQKILHWPGRRSNFGLSDIILLPRNIQFAKASLKVWLFEHHLDTQGTLNWQERPPNLCHTS